MEYFKVEKKTEKYIHSSQYALESVLRIRESNMAVWCDLVDLNRTSLIK